MKISVLRLANQPDIIDPNGEEAYSEEETVGTLGAWQEARIKHVAKGIAKQPAQSPTADQEPPAEEQSSDSSNSGQEEENQVLATEPIQKPIKADNFEE